MGLDLIHNLRAASPKVRIPILSMHDEVVYAERALRAGADGYVMKSDAVDKVLEALDTVLAGRILVSQKLSGLLIQRAINPLPDQTRPGFQSLTNRELEILALIGRGLSTDAIATRLF